MMANEGSYPENARALAMNGAEVVYRASYPHPATGNEIFEIQSRARALDNNMYALCEWLTGKENCSTLQFVKANRKRSVLPMHEKATVLMTIFTIVDDTMKGSPMIQQTLDRPGPAPSLSDSELVTLAIYQELRGEPREDHFFRLHQDQLRPYFPGLNERSRYNRSIRDLWSVILAVRISLQVVLDALQLEETAAIDSAPVPCMGYKRGKQASDFVGTAEYGVCSSKAIKYFGLKLHSVVSLTGVVMGRSRSPEPVATITNQGSNSLTHFRIT
jgi:hypothetical protein